MYYAYLTFLAFLGSLAPAVLFNVNRRNILWAGISGVCGFVIYITINNLTRHSVIAAFFGALVVGIFSEIMARLRYTPATIYSVCGIFPLVPGIPAYNTVQYIVDGNLGMAASKAIETIAVGGAIAFGIMMITAVFKLGNKYRLRKTKKS